MSVGDGFIVAGRPAAAKNSNICRDTVVGATNRNPSPAPGN